MHRLWEVLTEDLRGAGIIGRGYAALFEVRLASQRRSLVSGYSEKKESVGVDIRDRYLGLLVF